MPARRTASALFLAAILWSAGCSSVRMGHPITAREGDWTTFGRTPDRTGALPAAGGYPLEQVWEYDTKAGMGEGGLLAVDSFIVVSTMRGELHIVRAEDGKGLGRTSVGDAVHGSPVISGSNILIPLSNSGTSVAAFDLALGRSGWTCARGEVESSLLLIDRRVYAGTITGELLCLDASSGNVLWTFALPDNRLRKGIRSTPASWKDFVLFGADDGNLYALDGTTGALRWKLRVDGAVIAPPVVAGNAAFVGTLNGTLYAVDAGNGSVLWSARTAGPISGHVLVTDSAAIVGTNNGQMESFGRSDGRSIWKRGAGGPIVAGPVLFADAALVGTLRRDLVAIRCSNGELLWRQGVEGRVRTAPIVFRGMVLVATDQQELRAFRAGRGK